MLDAQHLQGTKTCPKCGGRKDYSEFFKSSIRKDGMSCWCKACEKVKRKTTYENSKGKVLEQSRKYYEDNKDRKRASNKAWIAAHPDRMKELMRRHAAKKYKESIEYRLSRCMSSIIYRCLQGGKGYKTWLGFVDYTPKQLKEHLERQFVKGMSWDNFGEWEIDHTIPKSVFHFSSPHDIDFKRCWSLSNLKPMWKRENIIKSNKLSKPFQPSLAIGA
jgi:hypothetical protein